MFLYQGMQQTKTIGLLLLLLLLPNVGLSQESIKVAVVNVAHLMEKAPQADAASKALEARFSPREKILTVERDILQSEEDNLSKNTTLSADKRIQKERALRERRRTYTRDLEDFREDLAVARSEALDRVQHQVFEAIATVAQKNKIDLVGQDFIYASKRVDITILVLQYLNSDFFNEKKAEKKAEKITTKITFPPAKPGLE